jgi:hypothetical protein
MVYRGSRFFHGSGDIWLVNENAFGAFMLIILFWIGTRKIRKNLYPEIQKPDPDSKFVSVSDIMSGT